MKKKYKQINTCKRTSIRIKKFIVCSSKYYRTGLSAGQFDTFKPTPKTLVCWLQTI